MPARRLFLAAAVLLPLLVAGCKVNTINSFPSHPASIRAANFITQVPVVDGRVGDAVVFPSVPYEGVTAYQDVDNTRSVLSFRVPGSESNLSQGEYDISGRSFYTMISYGTATAPSLLLLPDSNTSTDANKFQLRVANVAPTRATVDVYITGPTDSIDDRGPSFSVISYGTGSSYLPYDAGTYRIRIAPSGTKVVIYDSGARAFGGGVNYDLVVYTGLSAMQVKVALMPVNSDSPNPILPSTIAQVRAVNASPQTTPANALIDGTAFASALAYQSASPYNVTTPASHTLAFEAASTPGAIVASTTATLQSGRDYSMVLTGLAGANGVLLLQDENIVTTTARVRYVNTTFDGTPLTILLNDTQQAAGLAQYTASGYVSNAGGTFTLIVKNATTGAELLRLDGVTFTAAMTSTVYIVGSSGGLAAVIVQDV